MRRLFRLMLIGVIALALNVIVPVTIHAQDNQCPNGCDNGGGPGFDPSPNKVTNADGAGAFCEPFATNAGYYCTCEEVEQFFGAWTTGYFVYYGWVYYYYYVPYYFGGTVNVNVCVY